MTSNSKKKREIPRFSTPIIETHCHLDYLKEGDLEEIITSAKEVGIEKFITISVATKNLDAALEIAKNNDSIYCTQGIHPHEAKDWNDEVEKKIREQALHEKCLAIGEIGLDYHYDNSPRTDQLEAFDRQLTIAGDMNLPVVIHSREAEEDTIEILTKHLGTLKKRGVIHSFTASLELARFAIDNGFYLGFNGIITFKNAQNVRDALEITPMDKILLETDSPFLTPIPFRGKENAPKYLPLVAQKMAEVKAIPIEELLSQVYKNSFCLFSFS
jgi:TatD DNase family protein